MSDKKTDIQKSKLAALVPAYNEEKKIARVVEGIKQHLPAWVIDDGSADQTAAAAEQAGATVFRQSPNQGKGTALKLGFSKALERSLEGVLTIDADGQHDPQEIELFINAYAQKPRELIIGYRDFSRMPIQRRIANTLSNKLMSWALRSRVIDNQSGYRLIGRRLMEASLDSSLSGYEFEVDMLRICLQNGWEIGWVPIKTIYADEVSSIQPLRHVIRFVRLVLKMRRNYSG